MAPTTDPTPGVDAPTDDVGPAPRKPEHRFGPSDVAAAGLYMLSSAVGGVHQLMAGSGDAWRPWSWLLLALLITGLILFRRERTLSVLAAVVLLSLVQGAIISPPITFAVPIMLYAVGVYRGPRAALIAFAASAVTMNTLFVLWDAVAGITSVGGLSSAVAITLVVQTFGTLLGLVVGLRQRYVDALIDRAEHAEREQEQHARLAQVDERNRISREMHDIVGHTLTAIVNLSDGVDASLEHDPEQARRGVRKINEMARQALGETRGVLNGLADMDAEPAPRTPQNDRDWLEGPLDAARAAGLHVECSQVGEPPVVGGMRTSCKRIVQEAVTNTLRHAVRPTRLEVQVTHGPDRTEIYVSDDGTEPPDTDRGLGRGLLGIRERAALHHGTAVSGPAPTGGWYVYAELRASAPTDGGT